MMDWLKLLSLKRYGDTKERKRSSQDDLRLVFEVDFDRIIFSSEFRSLQDKTQVIPLSKKDFVHTRLTHSLEVSVVGRSLGRKTGEYLIKNYDYLSQEGYKFSDVGAIVAASCIAHDIGNPPFGHGGEKAIGDFFKTPKGLRYKSFLTEEQYQDLIDFEGNANGFRILTNSKVSEKNEGGLRLSYATLGTYMKYPKESLPKRPTLHIKDKKFGFFQSEKLLFIEIAETLGLKKTTYGKNVSFSRHPLSFLVEAADDICYTIIDFEDGINLGRISEDKALEYLINLVGENINRKKHASLSLKEDRIGYLRALAINTLIEDAIETFIKNEKEILEGKFSVSLLKKSKYKAQIEDILRLSKQNIYESNEVVEKKIVGYKIIHSLLTVFTSAVFNKYNNKETEYDNLILMLLPDKFKNYVDVYRGLLGVCFFIAGLSDGRVVYLYNKISGKSIF